MEKERIPRKLKKLVKKWLIKERIFPYWTIKGGYWMAVRGYKTFIGNKTHRLPTAIKH